MAGMQSCTGEEVKLVMARVRNVDGWEHFPPCLPPQQAQMPFVMYCIQVYTLPFQLIVACIYGIFLHISSSSYTAFEGNSPT